jgi:uncharacterized membrane protein YhaH (DUF805 family)
MELLSSFFLGHGRMARAQWLSRVAGMAVLCSAFGLLASQITGEGGAALFAALFMWGAAALSIQRLHDIGRAGPNLLLLLIPVLGPLWVLLLLCRRGGEGANRYGVDPLARLDYLRVDITK